jgi:hypothetical protein
MTLFPLLLKEKLREHEWQPSVLAENGDQVSDGFFSGYPTHHPEGDEPGRYQEPKQIVDGF